MNLKKIKVMKMLEKQIKILRKVAKKSLGTKMIMMSRI